MAIVFDAASSAQGTSVSSLSVSHTVAAGSDLCLFMCAGNSDAGGGANVDDMEYPIGTSGVEDW